MSRYCYDCDRDGKCVYQRDGAYSCSEGNPKPITINIDKSSEAIMDMTPEEATKILKNMNANLVSGRGNGKTNTMLKINWALSMAINALESIEKESNND